MMAITTNELKEYYSANFSNMVKKIYRSCGNYHDAEDIVQAAFERALKYKETCKTLDKWFGSILRNSYRDFLRVQKSWPVTRPIDDHVDEIEPVILNQLDPLLLNNILS